MITAGAIPRAGAEVGTTFLTILFTIMFLGFVYSAIVSYSQSLLKSGDLSQERYKKLERYLSKYLYFILAIAIVELVVLKALHVS